VVAIKSGEVTVGDVERVLDAARAVALPTDQDILHVLPQEFLVDGQDGIKEPVGMSGVRLEARVHIISTPIAAAQNVIKCCQRAGLHVVDLVFAPLAAAEAVLSPEEKELGVAVVEIGAGTTGLLAFAGGAVKHTAVLAVGGNHVSSDIAAGLRTPFRDAELLKRRSARRWRRKCRRRTWSRCRPSAGGRRASSRGACWRRSSSRASTRSSRWCSAS
jgi:cell division protein FtsA